MTFSTVRDLENSFKLNQLLNQNCKLMHHTEQNSIMNYGSQSNLNFMVQNASVTKVNVFTNAIQQNISKNLIPNLFTSNSIATSLNSKESGHKSQINSGRYKTELCRQYIENGGCKYGDKCQFAHGISDLKDVNRHPKYKTDYCKTFHSKGFCPYGPRCHFIHELNEKIDGHFNKKSKFREISRQKENSKLDKQIEALHTHLSSNLLLNDDFDKQQNYNLGVRSMQIRDNDNRNQQIDELNTSFLSSPSPPLSPIPQHRTRSGTSSTSSLVSTSSSYDMNQSDRIPSPIKPSSYINQQLMKPTYNIPMSKNLIQIGRNLIQEKLTNTSLDQETLNQQIANLERLNNLLNSNQLNFYQNPGHNTSW